MAPAPAPRSSAGTGPRPRAPPPGSALRPTVRRWARRSPSSRPSRATGGSWPTPRPPPDLVTDDSNDADRRLRVGPGPQGDDPGQPRAERRPGRRPERGRLGAGDLGRRADRRLLLVGHQPRGRRQQRVGDVFVYDRAKQGDDPGQRRARRSGGDRRPRQLRTRPSAPTAAYVAFASDAANLVADDTNNATDVFVHDRQAKTTTRVSVGPTGRRPTSERYSPVAQRRRHRRRLRLARPATWPPATPTAKPTSSSATSRPARPRWCRPRVGGRRRIAPPRPALSGDGRWSPSPPPPRPRSRRHQQRRRRLRLRPPGRRRPSGSASGPGGAQGDRASAAPAISADGRFVAFQLRRHQPRPGRHQPAHRRVRPRPAARHRRPG